MDTYFVQLPFYYQAEVVPDGKRKSIVANFLAHETFEIQVLDEKPELIGIARIEDRMHRYYNISDRLMSEISHAYSVTDKNSRPFIIQNDSYLKEFSKHFPSLDSEYITSASPYCEAPITVIEIVSKQLIFIKNGIRDNELPDMTGIEDNIRKIISNNKDEKKKQIQKIITEQYILCDNNLYGTSRGPLYHNLLTHNTTNMLDTNQIPVNMDIASHNISSEKPILSEYCAVPLLMMPNFMRCKNSLDVCFKNTELLSVSNEDIKYSFLYNIHKWNIIRNVLMHKKLDLDMATRVSNEYWDNFIEKYDFLSDYKELYYEGEKAGDPDVLLLIYHKINENINALNLSENVMPIFIGDYKKYNWTSDKGIFTHFSNNFIKMTENAMQLDNIIDNKKPFCVIGGNKIDFSASLYMSHERSLIS